MPPRRWTEDSTSKPKNPDFIDLGHSDMDYRSVDGGEHMAVNFRRYANFLEEYVELVKQAQASLAKFDISDKPLAQEWMRAQVKLLAVARDTVDQDARCLIAQAIREKVLSRKEAADLYGVHQATTARWLKEDDERRAMNPES